MMGRLLRGSALAGPCLALLLAAPVRAEERAVRALEAPAAEAPASEARDVDDEALAVVQRMTDTLGKATSLRFEIETSYDAVQTNGEKIEFGAVRDVVVRRPDRLRSDVVDRDGDRRTLRYDGQQLVVSDPDKKVWAAVARTGPLDELVDYVTEELGFPIPLAELFSPELPQLLGDRMLSGRYVGRGMLHDVAVDHVAFRNEEVGVQFWIAREGDPLPRRIVITYEHSVEEPQFRADFDEWDLSPRTPDSLFRFEPPAGFEHIQFVPRKRRADGPEASR
jgi:hypothetical protein